MDENENGHPQDELETSIMLHVYQLVILDWLIQSFLTRHLKPCFKEPALAISP